MGLQGKGIVEYIGPITDVETLPKFTVETGTYTVDATTKTVLLSDVDGGGQPTCDFTIIQPGDYLQSGTEIRKVLHIYAPYNARVDIDSPFTVDPSVQAFNLVRNKVYTKLEIQNTGAGTATINGKNFTHTVTPVVFENLAGLEAVIVNGSGSALQVAAQI